MSEKAHRRRTASALLITRSAGPDLEVLLVERSPDLRFFGGYHALPGGVRHRLDGPDDGDDGPALLRCAVRELLEETGLARFRPAPDAAGAEQVRDRLLDDAGQAADWLDAHRPEPLDTLCRIETPPFAPVLYDTVFYHVPLAPDETPTIRSGELTGGAFHRPADALAAWRRGELRIVPPVIILLEHLVGARGDMARFRTAIAATAEGYRRGVLHRVRFSPGIVLAALRTPTLPPATTTNCLIVGEEELWVVDPGAPDPGEQDRLVELLEGLVAEGRRLGGILATHHHGDHVGGVPALSRRLGLPVRGHPITLERLGTGVRTGDPLEEGDEIALGRAPDGRGDWRLRAVFTPGHDRGHLCFVESRYGAAIVGDMISTVSTIVIDPPEGHMRTYLESLERLGEEELSTLYPAHGPAVPDGRRLVRQYLRHREQREAALRAELAGRGAATPEELLPAVYWNVSEELMPVALRSLIAGLEKLGEDGVAEEQDGKWRLR